MKTRNRNKVKLRSNHPRLEGQSLTAVPSRGPAENNLEKLKARLLCPILTSTVESDLSAALHQAANEAAGAAWFTPFPLLFFPTLLDEKAERARLQHERQKNIRERTQGLLEQAITE